VLARADPHEGEVPIRSCFLRFHAAAALALALPACDAPPAGDFVEAFPCRSHADCDDGNPCTGEATCRLGQCSDTPPPSCDAPGDTCVVRGGEATCEALCPLPMGPALDLLRDDETLVFPAAEVELAVMPAAGALPDAVPWEEADQLPLAGHIGPTRVLARSPDDACAPADVEDWFDHTYRVVTAYPSVDDPGASPPVEPHDPRIVGWGHRVVAWAPGDDADPEWQDVAEALGPAEGDGMSVLPLGRGGHVVVALDPPAADGPGPDLAVFENGFSDGFLELARVEVSSDGQTFVPFAGVSRTREPVGAFEPLDATLVHGFAGVWRAGLGTPFDLHLLRQHELVRAGQVDLQRIRYVRVVDLVGDGTDLDAMGRPIFDPYPTVGSAGFDLDAIAVLEAP